jgi:hypothetical protein
MRASEVGVLQLGRRCYCATRFPLTSLSAYSTAVWHRRPRRCSLLLDVAVIRLYAARHYQIETGGKGKQLTMKAD